MNELKNDFYNVMYKYQKSFGETGVMANLQVWAQNKASLLELLRRHPGWVEKEKAIVIELHVAASDMGKVIGKQGRIAKAIRSVVKAAASKSEKKVVVDIV